MTLRRLTLGLLAAALAGALSAPVSAEQVFQNISTGPVRPLPTPTGISVYDAYFYPCNGWGGRQGRGHGRGNSGTGTINGERFYPYDPRSTSSGNGHNNGWSCNGYQGGSGHNPHPQPSQIPGPGRGRIPLPNPPKRIPETRATPRS